MPIGMQPDPYDDVNLVDRLERADRRERQYAELARTLTVSENELLRKQVDRVLAAHAASCH